MNVVRVAGDLLQLAVVGGFDGGDAAVFAVWVIPPLHWSTHALGPLHCDVGPGGWGWSSRERGERVGDKE